MVYPSYPGGEQGLLRKSVTFWTMRRSRKEGVPASDIPGDIPPAGIPLASNINHGRFGSFPAPAAVVCDKGELGGLQK